jgi:hypothetical protein
MEKKQNDTKLSENPVLLVKDIVQRTGKLDRELMYLLNKAKYYVPKTKPAAGNISSTQAVLTILQTLHSLVFLGMVPSSLKFLLLPKFRSTLVKILDNL